MPKPARSIGDTNASFPTTSFQLHPTQPRALGSSRLYRQYSSPVLALSAITCPIGVATNITPLLMIGGPSCPSTTPVEKVHTGYEIFHVRGIDLVERAVSLAVIGSAMMHPVAGFRVLEALGGHRAVILDRAANGSNRSGDVDATRFDNSKFLEAIVTGSSLPLVFDLFLCGIECGGDRYFTLPADLPFQQTLRLP